METSQIVIETGRDIGDSIQFDSSKTKVGENNVAVAIYTNKKIVFNESYTVVGDCLKCSGLHACYDLTVNGDVEVDNIDVKGRLIVLGNIKTKRLNCEKALICQGDIEANDIVVSGDIVADNIKCQNMDCSGNIMVRTTIDISKNLEVDKSVMAGEGIIGEGEFKSQNAVVAEYFEFDGEVKSKVIELETDKEIDTRETNLGDYSLEDIVSTFEDKLQKKISGSKEMDEESLLEFIDELSVYDKKRLNDWAYLLKQIVGDIAYLKSITNFRDYLFIVAAQHILPKEILAYETIEHVSTNLLMECESKVQSMNYEASDLKEFVYSLYIVNLYSEELRIEKEEALDKIFQSIGIKYRTVKQFLDK